MTSVVVSICHGCCTTSPTPPLQSSNPLNEDPPTSEEDFVMDYAEELEQFMSDSEQYMMEVERVIKVNTIVETIVAAVSVITEDIMYCLMPRFKRRVSYSHIPLYKCVA